MDANGFPEGVSGEQKRAALNAVLSSATFARAGNLCKILAYICEISLRGNESSLKEYTIAVEALGRSPSFDPAKDSVVRVEVSRLRKRLRRYYETEGAHHLVRIVLPESGYAPQFVTQTGPAFPEEQVSAMPPAGGPSGRRRAFQTLRNLSMPVGLAAAVVLGLLSWQGLSPARQKPSAGEASPQSLDSPAPALAGSPTEAVAGLRILAGRSESKFVDSAGRAWLTDRYFEGGEPLSRPDRVVLRTLDPDLYRTAREGDFRYSIPLRPGVYELRLHFAEIVFGPVNLDSDGVGERRFNVFLNGQLVLPAFDIVKSAGAAGLADEVVFKDVSPAADGFLHLRFAPVVHKALLSGLEIVPSTPGRMNPVRIVPGPHIRYDQDDQPWGPDRYFLGGRTVRRWTNVKNTADPGLYLADRWGHFSYAIPVAPGAYRLTLKFTEGHWGLSNHGTGGAGSRVFDVYGNGTALLEDFDIFQEAGGENRALDKTFRGVKPNPQGKLVLTFVPSTDYATISGIEVVDESEP